MLKFIIGLIVGLSVALIVSALVMTGAGYYGKKIAIVRIKGVISSSSSLFQETVSPESLFPIFDKIDKDPSVEGVLIELNSPGGSVVASREISMALKDMKKPSVCWMGDVTASGAYWIASACDKIVADPLSITGSIGVTASYLQFAGTLEKYGVTYERLVSGENKDAGSPFRNLTLEEEKEMMKIVNDTFEYFLEDVIKNRNLSVEEVQLIKGGNIMLAKDAQKIGLVDELGTWKDSKNIIKNVTGAVEVDFVEMQSNEINLFNLLSILV